MTQIHVFVVDDEKAIADTLCAILRSSGYEALPFYDAETALVACRNQSPDFVISDVSMPGISGLEMAVQIRQRFPECGVLLFSGNAGSREILDAAHRQGYEFELLSKPVHPRDLLARLDRAVRRPAQPHARLLDESAMAG
jgi:DNA-binding NtrC family response regulator